MNNGQTIEGASVVRETGAAYYLNVPGCSDSVWLPKSQMADVSVSEETYDDGSKPCRYVSATIPAWLYRKLPWTRGPVPYATRP
jgi:hypothetical protein